MDRPSDTDEQPASAIYDTPVTRRHFLAWVGGIAAGAVAATLGAIGLPPVVAPMFRDQDTSWTPVGNIGSVEPGQPDLSQPGTVVSSSFTRTVTDAYLPPEKQKTPVFIVCEGGELHRLRRPLYPPRLPAELELGVS